MNSRNSLPKNRIAAFTLIELLTVIAIIAILMGLLFPVLSSAKNSARRQAAAVGIRNIVAACKSYQTDYGKFPPVPAPALVGNVNTGGYYAYGDTNNGGCPVGNEQLFYVLRAMPTGPNANHALNKRQVRYFEMGKAKEPKTPRDGFTDFGDSEGFTGTKGQLLDPWGAQYCIVLDAADAGTIDMHAFFEDLKEPLRQSAAAFSMGIDGKRGAKEYRNQFRKAGSTDAPDDIVSWQ